MLHRYSASVWTVSGRNSEGDWWGVREQYEQQKRSSEGGEGRGWKASKEREVDVGRREMCGLGAAMVVWDVWFGWEVEDGITDLATNCTG